MGLGKALSSYDQLIPAEKYNGEKWPPAKLAKPGNAMLLFLYCEAVGNDLLNTNAFRAIDQDECNCI